LVLGADAVAAAEEAVGDEVLVAARETGVAVGDFIELLQLCGPAAEETLRWAVTRGIPVAAVLRAASALVRKVVAADLPARGRAVRRVLEALSPFGDWPAAVALLKSFHSSRALSPDALAGEIELFLDGLRARREDLYRGIAALTAEGWQ
jgi:hypothetical protein